MDAEEIARLVKDLRVSNETYEKVVTITDEEACQGRKRLENVVVGKIFSRRAITREMMRSNLPKILRVRGRTEIEVVGNNLFVISFSLESDKRVALEDGPWHFFRDLMILKQSRPMQTPMEVEFDEITLWIQCHNVPLECMEPSIIERIGRQVGRVEEVDVGERGMCVGKFARVRVSRPIEEPLVRCVPLKQEGIDIDVIVLIQYEKLPDFCFHCGRVGHISRDCKDSSVDKQRSRFDSWLRAGRVFGSRRDTDIGVRSGTKPSNSGGSENRWVAFRPIARVDEVVLEKEGSGEVGSKMMLGMGESGRVREDMEVNSGTGFPDVCMKETLVRDPMSGETEGIATTKSMVLGGSTSNFKVVGEGGRCAAGGLTKKGKGKSPLKLNLLSSSLGGKKWKRLARECKEGGRNAIGSEGSGGKKNESVKRRDIGLRDDDEEEWSHRRKISKVLDEEMGVKFPAEAASQPRQSL